MHGSAQMSVFIAAEADVAQLKELPPPPKRALWPPRGNDIGKGSDRSDASCADELWYTECPQTDNPMSYARLHVDP